MTIAIMTNFTEFRRGYSLTGIALDQAMMLARNGHTVRLFVNENYHGKEEIADGIILEKKVPRGHLVDFKSIREFSLEYAQMVENGLNDGKGTFIEPNKDLANKIRSMIKLKNDTVKMLKKEVKDCAVVITHDWIFQGWNLPYGIAVADACKSLPDVRWLHWIHSVPRVFSDWWDIALYGKKHRIVYPNKTDSQLVAEQYRGWLRDVLVIPHPKDYRSFGQFSKETWDFCDWTNGRLVEADVVQLYPASVDRLHAKRVGETIDIFAKIKKLGKRVCLVIANQWTTVEEHKQTVEQYKAAACALGLIPGEDLFFTSDFSKDFEVGVPLKMIWELFHFTNLYISFTREETYGLGIAEAALNGCLLVLNRSLLMLQEIAGHNALFFNMGSHEIDSKIENREQYHTDIARIIVARMEESEVIKSRSWFRRRGSLDFLYKNFYAPILADTQTWID